MFVPIDIAGAHIEKAIVGNHLGTHFTPPPALGDEEPFTFDVSEVFVNPTSPLRIFANPLFGLTFQADTYSELTAQIMPLAETGLGSALGACSSCACSTTPVNNIPLPQMAPGVVGFYYTGPLALGPFSASIGARDYPSDGSNQSLSSATQISTIDGIENTGSITSTRIRMDFEFQRHQCTMTSDIGDPFTASDVVTDITADYTMFNLEPCRIDPLLANGLAATALLKISNPREYICVGGFADRLNIGLQSGYQGATPTFNIETTTVFPSKVVNIKVPLGAYFTLSLTDQQRIINASLSNSTTQQLADKTLFPDTPVLQFNELQAEQVKRFLSVHLGTTEITITDQNGVVYTVSVEVEEPLGLGSSLADFDAEFIEEGHRRGIMPQLLKGIATVETSTLNSMAYRYEPFIDRKYFSQFGKNIRETEKPYIDYRFATYDGVDGNGSPTGLTQGIYFNQVDISPRSIYYIADDVEIRPILPSDQFVAAVQILAFNDGLAFFLPPNIPDQRWIETTKGGLRLFKSRLNEFGFTAQTSLAASYGIMQILYSTAIRPYSWSGDKPTGPPCYIDSSLCSPDYLFDTPINRAKGLGSVGLAGAVVEQGVKNYNKLFFAQGFKFTDIQVYEQVFNDGLQEYNQDPSYGTRVLNNMHSILPLPASIPTIQ